MTISLETLALVQSKADVVQRVSDSLKDSTKVLDNDILHALVQYALQSSRDLSLDKTIAPRLAQHHYQMPKLHKKINAQWNLLLELQRDLDAIRKYLGFESADALKATLDAGITKPLPAPPKAAKHIGVSDGDKILAEAKMRAEQAKLKAEQYGKNDRET